MVLLYLGPNTVMPLASFVAVLVGVVLIFWRFALGLVRSAFRVLFRRKAQVSPIDETPSDPEQLKN